MTKNKKDSNLKIKINQVHPNAKEPTYGSDGAACFDLYIADGKWPAYTTGWAFEIPEGYYMEVHVRSSIGIKSDVRLANGTGIIDSDYRGEVKLFFTGTPTEFALGERVAQAIVLPYNRCSFQKSKTLSSTKRGSGGFGSTGK